MFFPLETFIFTPIFHQTELVMKGLYMSTISFVGLNFSADDRLPLAVFEVSGRAGEIVLRMEDVQRYIQMEDNLTNRRELEKALKVGNKPLPLRKAV